MLSNLLRKKASLIVGIDIGSHSAKAVLLSQTGDSYKLESIAAESMPRGALIDREIQDIEAVGKVIAKLRTQIASSATYAAAAVSGPKF